MHTNIKCLYNNPYYCCRVQVRMTAKRCVDGKGGMASGRGVT